MAAAPPPTSHPGAPPEPPFLQVPDELLQEIFLRLPTAADLARASTACAAFRRVIADHKFPRCYRALHPPPLLGVIDDPFIPAQPPHPSAAAARAFAGFDFSCSSFLPSTAGRSWSPLEFFEGRTLLSGGPVEEDESDIQVFAEHEGSDLQYREFLGRDLAVCDPVHRRYVLLPAFPADLIGLIHKPDFLYMKSFLAPGEDDGDPLSFRVMCMAQHRKKLVLLIFSSGGHWRALTFDRSNDQELASLLQCKPFLSDRQYVHGRFCWQLSFPHKLLVLDVRVMEFSALDLPPEEQNSCFVIVEAAQGMLGMLSICYHDDSEDDAYWLTYSILRNNQWQSEKAIPLLTMRPYLMGVAGGYLLLLQTSYTTSSQEQLNVGYFSVEIKTLQVELFAGLSKPIFPGRLYAGFPPSLCAPTI